MKKLIILFLGLAVISCGGSDDDESMGRTTDPFIGVWVFINGDGITGELEINSNGTYVMGYPNDWDSPVSGTWINTATDPDFSSRAQTYLTNLGYSYLDPEEVTILFSADFNSFSQFGVEFVRK